MEIIGFLIQVFGIVILAIVILHFPLWYIAKKKMIFKKTDYFFPFIPLFFYVIINILGISKQSISNLLLELSIVVITTFGAYCFKIFSKNRNTKLILGIIFIFIFITVFFLPLIKE